VSVFARPRAKSVKRASIDDGCVVFAFNEENSPKDEKFKINDRDCSVRQYKSGKARGFSLVLVLIISVIGMALLGGIMYTFQSFAGASRATIANDLKYNILQDGVEKGKTELKARMNNINPPPRWMDKAGLNENSDIDSLSMLLLVDGVVLDQAVAMRDGGGRIKVEIFDMQYDPAPGKNDITITDDEELALLPPSVMIAGANAAWNNKMALDPGGLTPFSGGAAGNSGVYLIRATLVRGSEVKILESSIMQSNNEL
jgi:hypothetical protein